MKIGIQGIAGSYSEMTAQDYIQSQKKLGRKDFEIISYFNFKDVTQALLDETVDLIVVPVENSTTGGISKMMDQMRYKPVIAIQDAYQAVQHTLWVIAGTTIEEIKEVYSHPEALSQCADFFEQHPNLKPHAYVDTAKSVTYIKELQQAETAAIASPRAGKLYGLEPLLTNIQDEKTNMTRFYVVEKIKEKTYEGTRLSLYIETRHTAGALLKVLQVFDIFSCNLQSLTARPIENHPFTYGFFLEVSVSDMSTSIDILMQTLRQVAEHVQLMGHFYPAEAIKQIF